MVSLVNITGYLSIHPGLGPALQRNGLCIPVAKVAFNGKAVPKTSDVDVSRLQRISAFIFFCFMNHKGA